MTEDLAAWLLEQIAEDADRDRRVTRLARAMYEAFQPNNPYAFDEQADDVRSDYLRAAEVMVDREMPGVLAEVDTMRQIVASCTQVLEFASQLDNAGPDLAERTLRLLSLPLADRPGYRETWRP